LNCRTKLPLHIRTDVIPCVYPKIKDSRAHADCTKDEALDALQKNGAELVAFVAGLSDDELDRKGSMPAFGGEVTVHQVIEFVIFQSAQEHFDSMKAAVGR
jgi:hypothetical protein